jgi:hypothetical protein
MYGRIVPSNNEDYYQCSSKRLLRVSCGNKSINRPRVESFIWDRFFKSSEMIELVKKHFKKTDNKQITIELNQKLTKLKKQLKQNELELYNTSKLAVKNILQPDEADVQLKRIRQEKNDINTQILNFQNQIKTYQNVSKSEHSLVQELGRLIRSTSFNDKQMIIKKHIKSIEEKLVGKLYHLKIEFATVNIEPEYYIIHKRFKFAIEPKKKFFISFDKKYGEAGKNIKYPINSLAAKYKHLYNLTHLCD